MRSRKFLFALSAWTATVMTLVLSSPVLAQEEGAGGESAVSYASRFLSTDNPLGTGLVWFCLFSSVAIVAMIIQNGMNARASVFIPADFMTNLSRLLEEKNYREAIELANNDPSPFGQIMAASLNQASRGYPAMEMAMEETADAIGGKRVRNLIWLEIAGAAGPMIGLFGTVFGMILAFQQLVAMGGTPKAGELAGGIATALVCTFWGLVVGIPGVISASLYRVKYEALVSESIHRGKDLIAPFRPGGGGGGKKAAAPSPAASPAPASPKPATA